MTDVESDGEEVVRESPRTCPVCGQALASMRKYDVTVDVCDEHGIWFDRGEFEGVIARLRARLPRRSDVSKARRSGKMSGALFGWWSFLGD